MFPGLSSTCPVQDSANTLAGCQIAKSLVPKKWRQGQLWRHVCFIGLASCTVLLDVGVAD